MRKIVRSVVAAALTVTAVSVMSVGTAQASASIDITFEVGTGGTTFNVGDTNVPITIAITNNNDGNEASLSNTICDEGSSPPCNAEPYGAEGITFMPSCADLNSTCVKGDPDVFRLAATATASSSNPGNATCEGRTFDVMNIDNVLGLYHLTPRTPTRVVLAPGETCTLSFTGDVVNAPKVDQDPNVPGVQTGQYADVEAKVGNLRLPAFDANTDQATIKKSVPNFWTKASASTGVGSNITDTAFLTGRVNGLEGATVKFSLYGPDDTTCSQTPVFTSVVAVPPSVNQVTSDPFPVLKAGSYRWVARYSGDRNNVAKAGACNDADESVEVGKGNPMIVTEASPAVPAQGGELTDTARLTKTGTLASGGKITFRLYGPNDTTCEKDPIFIDPDRDVPTDGSPVTSAGHTPTEPGTYSWVAEYSGDANHNGAIGTCGDPTETVVVPKSKPVIVTKASGNAVVGVGQFTDTAQLEGVSLTDVGGTISFRLYGPNDATCSGSPVYTDLDKPFKGTSVTSGAYTPKAEGTYRWVASYSGDDNNESAVGKCGDPAETVQATVKPITLPPTGASTNWQAAIAGLLIAVGTGFVFSSRRRNSAS